MSRVPADIRINNFDLIRLLAASQVVCEHGFEHLLGAAGTPWWSWIVQAFPGVPIFFAVSGFLISMSYERVGGLATYLRNRFLRIYPGLWACLAVSLLTVVLFGAIDWAAVGAGRVGVWILAQVSIVQFYNPDWLRGYGAGVLNGSLWTIPVELQFYLVLPITYTLLRLGGERRRNFALVVTTAFFWTLNYLYVMMGPEAGERLWYKLAGVTFVPHIYLFFIGVLLQRNWDVVSRWVVGKGAWWVVGYGLVAAAMHAGGMSVGTNTPHPVGVLPLLGVVFALAYSVPTLADRLLGRNDISYGVYIYHMPVVNAFLVFGLVGAGALIFPLLGVTFALALVSWRLIERPALRHKQQTVHGLQTEVP
jgi:peptidoglycan/LPS O-acetylase OafA/YrhL